MRLAEILGHAIVDLSTARKVGKVGALVLDPGERRITSIDVDDITGARRVVGWEAVEGVGDGGVVIASVDALREASDTERARLETVADPVGRRVLTSEGELLGRLNDLLFDSRSGALEQLVVDGAEVDAKRLRAIGSYAFVVN